MPDGLSDFAEALANPIKYQNEIEKRSHQLEVFEDEDEKVSKPKILYELERMELKKFWCTLASLQNIHTPPDRTVSYVFY